ncbi:Uncharacterised protein [Mesomycoplasma dispar]|uniref:Uncharacterized protein n=1 Tax=Mesomycoplasma dispar TaxID=86660 RepID=A0AAJ5NQC6_9BACT|nr:hypothetical protein [Mesomycoplasma dispar]VEU61174.1 Uncharacterised protein [Mesomycoplasma dispar]
MDYSDNKYKNIFQRNIRFSLGTSILLDTNGEEGLFLTNNHILFNKKDRCDIFLAIVLSVFTLKTRLIMCYLQIFLDF